ncbi:hypothetical protein JTB14_012737 [Gonioctena quinquepunctata]|nr:hypothetical protein JTB14_012737 [Gonioctena quinquepunctata]
MEADYYRRSFNFLSFQSNRKRRLGNRIKALNVSSRGDWNKSLLRSIATLGDRSLIKANAAQLLERIGDLLERVNTIGQLVDIPSIIRAYDKLIAQLRVTPENFRQGVANAFFLNMSF